MQFTASPLFIALPKRAGLHHDESKGKIPLSLIALVNYLHMHGIESNILDLSTHELHTNIPASPEEYYGILANTIKDINLLLAFQKKLKKLDRILSK